MDNDTREPRGRRRSTAGPCTQDPRAFGTVGPTRCLVWVGAGVMLLMLWPAGETEAFHLRGGTLAWSVEDVVEAPAGAPVAHVVNITGQTHWNSFFWDSWFGGPALGQVFCPIPTDPAIGTQMDMGDGSQVRYCLRTTHVDNINDWVSMELVRCEGFEPPQSCLPGVLHTFVGPGPFLAWDEWNCRLDPPAAGGYHVNNGCVHQRLEIQVLLPGPLTGDAPQGSPRAFIPPVFSCRPDAVCSIPVAVHHPDGLPYTIRWSTAAEACGGCTWEQPGPSSAPHAAVIDASASRIEWNTTGATMVQMCATFYSAQVMVEEPRGVKVPVDWLINICDDEPPYWVVPPSPCGRTVPFVAGQPNSFEVVAAHNDSSRPVHLYRAPVPPLPEGASNPVTNVPLNPVRTTLTWNPSTDLVGTRWPLDYFAYVGHGPQHQGGVDDPPRVMYAPPCAVTILVTGPPPVADFQCTALRDPYLEVRFEDRSTTPNGTRIVEWRWDFGDGAEAVNDSQPAPFVHAYGKAHAYLVTLTVRNDVWGESSTTRLCRAVQNLPPVLDPLEDQVVFEGMELMFTVTGRDPDGDPTVLTWSRAMVPASARFEPDASGTWGRFAWVPPEGSTGVYGPVTFRITELTPDGRSDQTSVFIRVLPLEDPRAPSGMDSSGDGVPDHVDNCPWTANPDQSASGGAGMGDACAPDAHAQGDEEGEDAQTAVDPEGEDGQVEGQWGPACPGSDRRPTGVEARAEGNGSVAVSWDSGDLQECAPAGFLVWMGEGGVLVASLPYRPGDGPGQGIVHEAPWRDREYRYWVQAVGPDGHAVFDASAASPSGPVDLRSCHGPLGVEDAGCGTPSGEATDAGPDGGVAGQTAWAGSPLAASMALVPVLAVAAALVLAGVLQRRRR